MKIMKIVSMMMFLIILSMSVYAASECGSTSVVPEKIILYRDFPEAEFSVRNDYEQAKSYIITLIPIQGVPDATPQLSLNNSGRILVYPYTSKSVLVYKNWNQSLFDKYAEVMVTDERCRAGFVVDIIVKPGNKDVDVNNAFVSTFMSLFEHRNTVAVDLNSYGYNFNLTYTFIYILIFLVFVVTFFVVDKIFDYKFNALLKLFVLLVIFLVFVYIVNYGISLLEGAI